MTHMDTDLTVKRPSDYIGPQVISQSKCLMREWFYQRHHYHIYLQGEKKNLSDKNTMNLCEEKWVTQLDSIWISRLLYLSKHERSPKCGSWNQYERGWECFSKLIISNSIYREGREQGGKDLLSLIWLYLSLTEDTRFTLTADRIKLRHELWNGI